MRHSQIIDDLARSIGSQAELARRLDVGEEQVSRWKERGIPARHWPCVLAIANYSLTLDDIVSGSPLRPAKRVA
jgi:hypothetical protein